MTVNLWTILNVLYIVMLFHCLHEFLMHVSFNFPDFPMTPRTGDWAVHFFSKLQFSHWHKSLAEVAASDFCGAHQLRGIFSIPDWFHLSPHRLSAHPAAWTCGEMLYMMLLGNVNKRKTRFCSSASDLMMHYHDGTFIAHASNPLTHDSVLGIEGLPWQSCDQDCASTAEGRGSVPGCWNQDPTCSVAKKRKEKASEIESKNVRCNKVLWACFNANINNFWLRMKSIWQMLTAGTKDKGEIRTLFGKLWCEVGKSWYIGTLEWVICESFSIVPTIVLDKGENTYYYSC